MRTPYIYTMPESFLQDQSVPARWRLLAVINSFLLNGKEFYGSNAWLMQQLSCTEPTVTAAVAELEALGEVIVVRTRRSRVIKRKMSETQTNLGLTPKPTLVLDPNQLAPISDSISETKKAIAKPIASPSEFTRVNTTTDGEEIAPKKKYAHRGSPVWELRKKLYAILSAHIGDKPVVEDMSDYVRLSEAVKLGLSEEDIVDIFENALADDDDIVTVRSVFTNAKMQNYVKEYL